MLLKKFRFSALTVLGLLLLMGCSSPNNPDEPEPDPSSIRFTNELITDKLELPWQMSFTNDGRMFLTERIGNVRVIENDQLIDSIWFDGKAYLAKEGKLLADRSGVQGIAVHPDFKNNGYVYLGLAYQTNEVDYDYNRIIRLKEDPETNQGIFDKVILDKVPGWNLHNAGQLKFGPDEKLYWSVGDRFEVDAAQDLDDLSGSILRLNPDGSVPNDNPFSGSYIYSYGHRNPQGFDWHADNEMMIATEHGPSSSQGCCHDEINVIEAGKNYGWPNIRGDETAPGMETPMIHSGVAPEGESVLDYVWAPSGAEYIEDGPWAGTYLFAGLRSRMLWQIKFDQNYEFEELIPLVDTQEEEYFRARSVSQAPDGTIYMITSNKDYTYNPDIGRQDYVVKFNVFYEE